MIYNNALGRESFDLENEIRIRRKKKKSKFVGRYFMGTVCRSYFGTHIQHCANKEINTNPFDEIFNAISTLDLVRKRTLAGVNIMFRI